MVVPAYPGRVDLRIKYNVLCHFLFQRFFPILLETLGIFFLAGGGGSWIFLPIQLVVRFMHCNIYLKSFFISTGNLGDLRCNLKGIHWYIILNCHDEGSTRVAINERKI